MNYQQHRWANEAARRAEVVKARQERESLAGIATVTLNLELSGFITAMRNLSDAMAGRTPHGARYYSTRDGRIHRRGGSTPLLHNGRRPR